MSGINTGVGLISGLPISDIIDQLMSIESRPKQLIQRRSAVLTSQQAAFQQINAKLLALKTSAADFTSQRLFNATAATTSNESVLTATSSSSAVPGNYSFTVKQLVSSQQTITRGFADTDATARGPGTLSFERGEAKLADKTSIASLNGGQGIERGQIRITDRSGASAIINLSDVITVDDVLDRINGAFGVNVQAAIDGDGITITDTSGGVSSDLIIANVGASSTASSLGLAGASGTGTLTGTSINQVGRDTQLSDLNDGNGVTVRRAQNDFAITSAGGGIYNIDLTDAQTLGDVIDTINTATGGQVTAAVGDDGVSLKLTDAGGGGAGFTVTALNNSTAASDLGILGADDDGDGDIAGRRILASMNSKLVRYLNGGAGVDLGVIDITNRSGASTQIDLAGAHSVQELIDRINDSGAGVTASLNQAGNGLRLTDTSGGLGQLQVADVSGSSAADLNLAGLHDGSTVDSGSLRFQFVTGATTLEQLGITRGKFEITDSAGSRATVDLTQGDEVTISDVLSEINSRGLLINARINDTGDGILIEDTGPGTVALKIEESGSTTAASLGLLGEAAEAGENLDGSFRKSIEILADDTLKDIVTKINDAKVGVSASIINDGSGSAPYRLILSSKTAGSGGSFVFDDGGMGLGANTLSEAQDAVTFFGSSDPAKALVITSRSNTLEGVIPGATVNLKATSNQPAQITISKDQEQLIKSLGSFVENFNAVVETLDKYDSYDAETEERGLLLGDPTVGTLRRSLFSIINQRNTEVSGQYQTLTQVGIRVGSGAKLELNEERLREALRNDPEAVEALFTFRETEENEDGETVTRAAGIGVRIDELLARLTDSTSGPVQGRIDSMNQQIELNKQRIEGIDKLLESKRLRLEAQFLGMERVLAEMQRQSQALASFRPLQISSGGGGNSMF